MTNTNYLGSKAIQLQSIFELAVRTLHGAESSITFPLSSQLSESQIVEHESPVNHSKGHIRLRLFLTRLDSDSGVRAIEGRYTTAQYSASSGLLNVTKSNFPLEHSVTRT